MEKNRRLSRTPFSAVNVPKKNHTVVFDSAEEIVAVVQGDKQGHAEFIVKACNRYDMLMEAFDLCRGQVDGLTQSPHESPALAALRTILETLHNDVITNGR